jgi:hypothetical protein
VTEAVFLQQYVYFCKFLVNEAIGIFVILELFPAVRYIFLGSKKTLPKKDAASIGAMAFWDLMQFSD